MGFFLKVQMYRLGKVGGSCYLGKVVEWGGKLLPGKGGGVGWGIVAYLGGKVPTVAFLLK